MIRMRTKILIFSILFLYLTASCQKSEYVKNFDWMVKTFQENDAGYETYLKQKGEKNIAIYTNECREKILQAKSEQECISIMNEWLHYFRKGHIGVFPNRNNDSNIYQYNNEKKIALSKEDFTSYLQINKNSIHPIEGIWTNQYYTIGIIKSKNDNNHFESFIIEANNPYWTPGQIKAELNLLEDNSFDVTFLMKDHTKKQTTIKWHGHNQNIIRINGIFWVKAYPKTDNQDQLFYEFVTSNKPFIKKLSESTIYLRIPSFELSNKEAIDKLLESNDNLIKSTPNLIIDIRYGTGGSDYSHYGLIPYYFTNSIRNMSLTYRATELNALAYEKYARQHIDSNAANFCRTIAKKMRENLGGYYDSGTNTGVITSYNALKYPAKIAIICNKNNASADEGFLYMARQSYKVKIFGESTAGAFDFSNVNIVDFPDGKSVLWITMSMSKRLPNYQIDDIGIQPDYFIEHSTEEKDWVTYVRSVIEEISD